MYQCPISNDCVYNHNFNESNYITPFTIDIDEKTSIRCYNKQDDSLRKKLLDNIKKYHKIDHDNILLSAGSDMALHLTIETLYFIKNKRSILIPLPTYTHMKLYCEKYFDTDYLNLHIDDNNDIEKIDEKLSNKHYDIIYINTPNNPTGKSYSKDDLIKLFDKYKDTFFIIDEAYVEFSKYKSLINIVNKYSNVNVTRTFSKLYGLAGIRLGYMCCHSIFYNDCMKLYNPKQITTISIDCGLKVFENHDYYQNIISEVKRSKKRILDIDMSNYKNSIKIYNSDANYLLYEIDDKQKFENILNKFSISIRNRNDYSLEKCFRITIGTIESTNNVIKALNYYGEGMLKYQTFFIDLDETLIENMNGNGLESKFYNKSKELLNFLLQNNKDVYILTNNCRYNPHEFCQFFAKNNITFPESNIITPIRQIVKMFKNKTILICASDSQIQYLKDNGVNISNVPNNVDAIVFHNIYSFNYEFIINYTNIVSNNPNIPIYVSDNDKSYNSNGITYLDMGSLVNLFDNINYQTLGKPNANLLDDISYDKNTTIIIGDSETDYKMSRNINCDFIHVNKKNSLHWNYDIEKKCFNFNSIECVYNEII